ncbi:DgyrCDS7164 [Dimorphilus gyrociliatus]|uniref:DgyrCDS7164 n=1 Tax=Dimorphilus gyrociliatus TaxID=2664684 RepID=A0A7I8VRW8_9ANNE|nr:DgyrCDS7164 [Dimorphilus gyrociliatus]
MPAAATASSPNLDCNANEREEKEVRRLSDELRQSYGPPSSWAHPTAKIGHGAYTGSAECDELLRNLLPCPRGSQLGV